MSQMKCKPEEKVCCCVDVGTVIDNEDCSVDFAQVYASEEQAQQALDYLTEKAKAAESERKITSEITQVDGGYQLKAAFEFCCQAEAMIFQLSTR
ncbi:YfcZ/YiiS family protein [Gallibacterium anatis]|uniref:YfcZ/YiiS family protein n=1 Tax=Gallibacterium anatis TaxID=750 RepID=A0A930UWZ9_9PAST|nr:YfcZ/YiiS family protein [Gallibacterium anatis]